MRLRENPPPNQRWIKISVHDTGEGIPDDIRRRIFEPFFTTKAPGKGTGLGLSIVRDIVGTYQGVLEVESELHQGTTFVVRLPLSEPASLPAVMDNESKAA